MKERGNIGHNSCNLHAVDELAHVRVQIRALKEREDELRQKIIESGDYRGDNHMAMVHEGDREQWDHQALKEEFGMARLRPFIRRIPVTTVRIREV